MALNTALHNLSAESDGKRTSMLEQNRKAIDFIKLRARIKNNLNLAVHGTKHDENDSKQRQK